MEKSFITKEGKRVFLNEPFNACFETKEEGCTVVHLIRTNKLEAATAERLVRLGVLKEYGVPKAENITINDMFKLIGEWIVGTPDAVGTIVELLNTLPDYIKFEMMLRAAAVLIDRKYPDHINNAKVDKYYTINMTDGKVCEVPKKSIKNFRNFAAFRTLDDIKIATKLLRPLMKHIWPSE
jgi:hypothetical protein